LACLFLLTSSISRFLRTRLPISPLLIHLSGTLFLILKAEPAEVPYRLTALDLAGCAVALAICILYLTLDWIWASRAARRPKQAEAMI
jgi:hypothetical protein